MSHLSIIDYKKSLLCHSTGIFFNICILPLLTNHLLDLPHTAVVSTPFRVKAIGLGLLLPITSILPVQGLVQRLESITRSDVPSTFH